MFNADFLELLNCLKGTDNLQSKEPKRFRIFPFEASETFHEVLTLGKKD